MTEMRNADRTGAQPKRLAAFRADQLAVPRPLSHDFEVSARLAIRQGQDAITHFVPCREHSLISTPPLLERFQQRDAILSLRRCLARSRLRLTRVC